MGNCGIINFLFLLWRNNLMEGLDIKNTLILIHI